MSQTTLEEPKAEVETSRTSRFGIAGCIVGFVALAVSATSPWILDLVQPAPAPAEDVAEFTVKALKSVKEKLKKPQPAAPVAARPNVIAWPMVLTVASISLGLIGVLLGTVSWIKREDHRISGVAAVAGSAAIAWQYLLLAAGVLVLLIIIGIIASMFGGG